MKNLILLSALLFSSILCAQFKVIPTTSTFTQNGNFMAVDIDKNGQMDAIFSVGNWNNTAFFGARYLNQGNQSFKEIIDNRFNTGTSPTFSAGDTDGDGLLDIIYGGTTCGGMICGLGSNNELYKELPYASIATGFCDFSNIGLMGYYLIGGAGKSLFHKSEIDYTWSALGDGAAIWTQCVTQIDYDNDGDIDLFVTGSEAPDWASSIMYKNNNGIYSPTNIGVTKYGSRISAAWADVNNDGYPDLLIGGAPVTNDADGDSFYLYYNNGDGTMRKSTYKFTYSSWSSPNGCAFADWNNDGFMDIIVTGAGNLTVFENDKMGGFPGTGTWLMGLASGNIQIADMNGDHNVDILISGNSWYEEASKDIIGIFYNKNTTNNQAPSIPLNLHTTVNGSTVIFNWDPSSDDKTPTASLSYNLYVKNKTTGRYYMTPLAEIEGNNNGRRYCSGYGNIYMNKSWMLQSLPDGQYEWSVQAIDAGYIGSKFATKGSFTIGIPLNISENISKIEVITKGQDIIITGTFINNIKIYSIDGSLLYNNNVMQSKYKTTLNHGSYIILINNQIRRKIVL